MEKYDIFISYRRSGGADKARILKAELEKRGYQDRVFLDYDELRDGKFDRIIMDAIEQAPLFIFILTPGALDRCSEADDWVRQEILYAVQTERHIIPVNFDKLFNAFPDNIPADIRTALGQHQFSQVDTESLLRASVDQLVADRIEPVLSALRHRPSPGLNQAPGQTPTTVAPSRDEWLLAQDDSTFRPQCRSTGYGFVDSTGTPITPFKYEWVENFSDGLARVRLQGRWGYIDRAGHEVLTCRYDEIKPFTEGFAPVRINRKWGFIDRGGHECVPCHYDAVQDYSDGMAAVARREPVDLKTSWGYVDTTGREVIPCTYHKVTPFDNGRAHVELHPAAGHIERCYVDKLGNRI